MKKLNCTKQQTKRCVCDKDSEGLCTYVCVFVWPPVCLVNTPGESKKEYAAGTLRFSLHVWLCFRQNQKFMLVICVTVPSYKELVNLTDSANMKTKE